MTAEVAAVMLEERGRKETVPGAKRSDHTLIRVSRVSIQVDAGCDLRRISAGDDQHLSKVQAAARPRICPVLCDLHYM